MLLVRFIHWLVSLSSGELMLGALLLIGLLVTVAAMMIVCWRGSEHIPDWPDQT